MITCNTKKITTILFILSNVTTAKKLCQTVPRFRYSQNTSMTLLRERLNQDVSFGHHGSQKISSGIITKDPICMLYVLMVVTGI